MKNKLNITDKNELFEAEKELTAIRLRELQEFPIKGKFDFNLSVATHSEMLEASKLSFDKAESSGFIRIFTKAVIPLSDALSRDSDILNILTSDDLMIETSSDYDYYGYNEHEKADIYDSIYQAKITEMDAKKKMSDAKEALKANNGTIERTPKTKNR